MSVSESSRDVLLQCPDLEAAVRYYHGVLGLPITQRSENLVGFETGAFCLYVEKGPAYGPVFEFHVADLAAAKAALVAAGCRVEKEEPAVPRCYVRDPLGLVYNLAERREAGSLP
jgi:catechol 2,3-dioxygenase-like lactoylglutathione lyase family enzyme